VAATGTNSKFASIFCGLTLKCYIWTSKKRRKFAKRYAALLTDMIKLTFLQILVLPLISFGQNKFVGEYVKIQLEDTSNFPRWGYLYNKCFKINSDSSFFYYEEENPTAFDVSHRETFEGSWVSSGDTITFYNRNFRTPKAIKFNHIENQKFKGIKIIVKDFDGSNLNIDWCSADSLSPDKKHRQLSVSYKSYSQNCITVTDKCYDAIYFRPHGHCEDFRHCDIGIGLDGVKDGTIIEVICHSNDMALKFHSKRYVLTRNILHEISTSCNMPDAWTDNFIKKK